jgi:S1-C subfamily serine protease
MVGRSRAVLAALAAGLALCGLPGCTYHSTLDSKFYTARDAGRTNQEKIPLKVALFKDPELDKLTLAEANGGHGVDIKLGDAVLSSLKTEMDSLFESVTIVNAPAEAVAAQADTVAFFVLDWRRVSADVQAGQFSYLVLLQVQLRDRAGKYEIGNYRSIKPVDYTPTAAAKAGAFATGASLFLLAPIIVPLTTQAVGDRAEEVAKQAITDVVRAVGAQMAADDSLRDYRSVATAAPGSLPASRDGVAHAYARPSSPYDRFLDAVVVVSTPAGIGSGFFVSSDGYIVTNRHVIGDRATASVKIRSGPSLTAATVAASPEKDLALLKISGDGFRRLELSTGADAGVGREVIAIGTPQELSWSVSKGIVSAVRDQRKVRLIQTDAAVNAGNSGGPLIELSSGKVIGVNTLGFKKSVAEGLNFAVSAEDVRMTFGRYLRMPGQS